MRLCTSPLPELIRNANMTHCLQCFDALFTVFSARANRGVNLLINAVGYLWGPHLVNTACISFIFLQLQFEGPKKKLKCDPG